MCEWCAGTGHPHGDPGYGMCECPVLVGGLAPRKFELMIVPESPDPIEEHPDIDRLTDDFYGFVKEGGKTEFPETIPDPRPVSPGRTVFDVATLSYVPVTDFNSRH